MFNLLSVKPAKTPEPEVPHDPKTCEIPIDKEVTIELEADKDCTSLGIELSGGLGTPMVSVFHIFKIHPGLSRITLLN